MYKLSRLFSILAVIAGVYSAALAVLLFWPASAFAIGLIGTAMAVRKRRRHLTTLGSARWANENDLAQAGMLDGDRGLILGRPLKEDTSVVRPNIRRLLTRRIDAKDACRSFYRRLHQQGDAIVRLPQAVHSAVFAPSGIGKGVSIAVPFLQSCDDALVAVDFKGELAKLTADYRRKRFGHRIVLLDPYRVVTKQPDCFNPLDFIRNDPQAIDQCRDLANALVVRPPEEKEPHWNNSAEFWIGATIATVVQYGDQSDTRSLQTVRDILSYPDKLEIAIKLMCESDCWEGMLARMGGQLRHYVDKERSSTLTTVSTHLRFLDTPAIAASTRTSSFDPNELQGGKLTVYLILPPEHMRAQSGLLRLWIGSLLRAVVRGGLQQ